MGLCHLFCLVVDSNVEVYDGACSAEQAGIKADPMELTPFLDFVKHNKLEMGNFIIGTKECK